MQADNCVHVFLAGASKGQTCGAPGVLRGDLCQEHLRLDEPNAELNTCHHQFESGPRAGLYCPLTIVNDVQQKCELHMDITEPGPDHCSYVRTAGQRKGTYCNQPPVENGLCFTHNKPSALVARVEGEKATCFHEFGTGKNAGKWCPELATREGKCKTHHAQELKVRENTLKKHPIEKPEGLCTFKFAPDLGAWANLYCGAKIPKGLTHGHKCASHAVIQATSCGYIFKAGPKVGDRCLEECVKSKSDDITRCYAHLGKVNTPKKEKKVKQAKAKKVYGCAAQVVAESHICHNAVRGGGLKCWPHRDATVPAGQHSTGRCRVQIVKYRRCARAATEGTQHCATHANSTADIVSDDEDEPQTLKKQPQQDKKKVQPAGAKPLSKVVAEALSKHEKQTGAKALSKAAALSSEPDEEEEAEALSAEEFEEF